MGRDESPLGHTSSEKDSHNYVRLAGNGLPGGEQSQCSSNVSAAPANENESGRGNPMSIQSSSSALSPTVSAIPVDENHHRYIGLVNQAMTCYLNSLIQSLYMTPEFRNAMYEWEYIQQPAHAKELRKKAEQSIPCQLQKLFLLLQTSENDSLETKDLTQSFGWTSNEAYDQHDVQELCRLMFDALEHKWKGTKHEKLIQDLYRGTMEDFVACLKCGRESVKTDYFLDLPLAVKPFGAVHAYKSVEEALGAFVQPELLEGSNQYMCENCKSKQDAHKGLRITQFPYLLTIQLKRFDFDYNTMHRIKLNDKMTFPDVLDLNDYVSKEKPISTGRSIEVTKVEEDDADLGSPNPKRWTLDNESPNRDQLGDEKACVGQTVDHESVNDIIKERGENVYELFSVMVHSGNAAGGHYFAYIKNLDQNKWYIFNDTRVDFASSAEIEKSFGGHPCGWNQSNTNAYMLMYRKVDPKRNASFILSNQLPKHIKDSQEKWKILEREAEEERLRKLSLIQVYVNINYPFPSYVKLPDGKEKDLTQLKYQITEDFCEYKTEISREMPIKQVFGHAFEFFHERARAYNMNISKSNARLIYVEHGQLRMDFRSPADMEKKLRTVFNHHLSEPVSMYGVNFLLDIRMASTFFPVDIHDGITIKVQRVDIGKMTTANELVLVIKPEEKMLKVKQWIGSQFRDDIHAVCDSRMVLEAASSRCEFLIIDSSQNGVEFGSLISRHMGQACPTLYYDGGLSTMVTADSKDATISDRKKSFEKSAMFQVLDRKCFTTFVKVRLPSQEEIDRAASTKTAYQGPSWLETVATSNEENKVWTESRSPIEVMSTVSKNDTAESLLNGDADEEPISGRVSTASMRSISMDDIDGADLFSGSFCNNTPQMSPCVSDGDDCDRSISLDGKNQLLSDYMQNKSPEFTYQSFPESLSHNRNLKIALGEETLSEAQSAVSSGQSTLVPSSSTHALSSLSRKFDDAIDGKIVTVVSHENFHKLDVDSRMKVSKFKKWVSEQLGMDRDQFVIVKHASDDGSDSGYETNFSDDEVISSAFQSCYISIKLRAPLKQDEKMIQIVLFDMLENQRDNWKTLFELPVSQSTIIGDVLLQCIRLYKEVYGEELTPNRVRLRDIGGTGTVNGRSVLNPNDTMDKRTLNWCSHLFMQIISDEKHIGKPGEPVMVRRFRPSTVEVSATHEVLVNSKADNPVQSFVEAVSEVSGIPVDRLAITDPKEFNWQKWPFVKSRLEMLDSKVTFTANLHLNYPNPREFLDKVGCRVLYYKDIAEEAKILSDDERKQIKIKENGQSANANRRKERPLRIQMSSVCEA